ncbi:MAG: thioredoxin family protein [Bacteroidales bacterium]|nr:thioredoxin family protein [Bacteroidales bacterium]
MKTSRSLFLAVLITFTINAAYAQTTANIYNPSADASAEISAAVLKAKAENKHVLLQVGGNWCSWCVKFHKLIHTDTKIDSVMKANYIFVLVNHSKENRNYPLLKELEFPQRFGFPVLVVLNPEGKRIHTQATDLLESGDGYDNKKVISFH